MSAAIEVFEKNESGVRSYCRKFPKEFSHARNAILIDTDGNEYIDFFAGAGAINYGHNNPYIKGAIVDYLYEDHIIHALDMYTEAKEHFLSTLSDMILKPRGLEYKVMCCGSTGTNAVEAAIKLARKVKGRTNVFAFTGAFHGMTLGSLAMTGDRFSRNGGGVPLSNVTFVPYYDYFDEPKTSLDYLEKILSDDHSGIDKPAAIITETVQAEGGINVAPTEWLQRLRSICTANDILLIVDDIQVGVGRTGSFFSFERAGIVPDMVVLSKSISGFGLPMSILLMKAEYDCFSPAEHNGTFRGNQLAFVGSKAGMEYYIENNLDGVVHGKSDIIKKFLESEILPVDSRLMVRGIGMIWGIDFSRIDPSMALRASHACFDRGLVIELAGREDCVLKILPPLTIEEEKLMEGLSVIKTVVCELLNEK